MLIVTSSLAPGSASLLQFAASLHNSVPAPPSQATAAKTRRLSSGSIRRRRALAADRRCDLERRFERVKCMVASFVREVSEKLVYNKNDRALVGAHGDRGSLSQAGEGFRLAAMTSPAVLFPNAND